MSMQYAGFVVVVVVLQSVIALECGIRHGINIDRCIRDCNVYPGLGDLCIVKYCPSMDVLWDGICFHVVNVVVAETPKRMANTK